MRIIIDVLVVAAGVGLIYVLAQGAGDYSRHDEPTSEEICKQEPTKPYQGIHVIGDGKGSGIDPNLWTDAERKSLVSRLKASAGIAAKKRSGKTNSPEEKAAFKALQDWADGK